MFAFHLLLYGSRAPPAQRESANGKHLYLFSVHTEADAADRLNACCIDTPVVSPVGLRRDTMARALGGPVGHATRLLLCVYMPSAPLVGLLVDTAERAIPL